ncbi:MAG: aldehyde dehydrogenase family protein [Synergistaceae bacterium]|jgi:aldehyde dehydrogenase (NAD+)|nr:aldehyde dehydrogenase family protein [Synergistaceae bacterium]
MKEFKLFINNQWLDAADGKTFTSVNPANKQPVSKLASATRADVAKACQAARGAFYDWSFIDAAERADYMLKIAQIMRRRFREMAEYEAMETGKPVSETLTLDIPYSIEAFEYFSGICREIKGEVLPVNGERGNKTFDFVTYEPYGVAAVIAPYNFPLHLLTRSLAPALAAGNTCVCKASSITPSTAAILSEIAEEAKLPAGVINVLHGAGGLVGEALCTDENVDVIAFTGSQTVGRQILRYAADSKIIKKCVLELGGKGPNIVEPDCDMEEALSAQLDGFTFNQGEVCCAMTRLILHEDIYDEFLERLAEKASARVMGDTLDEKTNLGSLISEAHLEFVDKCVKDAIAQGAKLYCGGERYSEGVCAGGSYYKPTVLVDVTPDMQCFQEEIFGPVLVVTKYRDMDEAVKLANDSAFGLGANIFCNNHRKTYWAAKKINAGTIWVNMPNGSQMHTPFGGSKNSGMGREYGTYGLHEYLKIKNNVWNMEM